MSGAKQKYILDDERILQNEVSSEELSALERTLLRSYLEKAKKEGRQIIVIRDLKEYSDLGTKVFEDNNFYLLINPVTETIVDMAPIVYRLIDTIPEALFYAKIMQHAGHPHF